MKKFLLAFLFFLPLVINAQPPIPELWGVRVHDEAHILSTGFVDQLEQRLKSDEDSTSNQIAVLIIKSLEDYPLEDYTLKVAEKWKLAAQDKATEASPLKREITKMLFQTRDNNAPVSEMPKISEADLSGNLKETLAEWFFER